MSRSGENNNTRQKVEIYGEKILITSSTSPGYVGRVAQFVNMNLEKLGDRFSDLPRNKILILGLMNLAGEMLKYREECSELQQENGKLKKDKHQLSREITELENRYRKLKREFDELYKMLGEGG
ncbi:MAG: cell division protein ZapA [Halanaerobium sp.]|nr:cell division protein ZapA [Halanaerobium sp.]